MTIHTGTRHGGCRPIRRLTCALPLLLAALAAAATPGAHAQGNGSGGADAAGSQRGAYAGMGHAMGEITAVEGDTVLLKTGDGATEKVVTTDNTRILKDRIPVHLRDLHPGDGIMAMGNLDAPNKTLHAAVLMAEDAAAVKAMRDNLGKTYISGRVTAVDLDDARLTVERPDHVAQTIGLDDSTSFRRAVRHAGNGGAGAGGAADGNTGEPATGGRAGRRGGFGMGMLGGMDGGEALDRAFNSGESITLADIKAGDFVAGTGALKHGVFVPTRLIDSPPRVRREGHPGSAAGSGAAGSPGQEPR